jgi:hypothetical protein
MRASKLQISEAMVIDFLTRERKGKPSFRRRERLTEFFARIPFERARKLGQFGISGTAWWLLIEIDRLNFEGKQHPVKLTSAVREALGITRWALNRGLCQLERAGAVTVKRKRGRCPLVTISWYPWG